MRNVSISDAGNVVGGCNNYACEINGNTVQCFGWLWNDVTKQMEVTTEIAQMEMFYNKEKDHWYFMIFPWRLVE